MKYGFLALGLLSFSACSNDPADYETPVVTVKTEAGDVTCQLYRRDMVLWDRALTKPATLSDEAANAACRNEGGRERNAGTPAEGPATETTTTTAPL
ncbi:hypothetical protein GL286_14055 [Paracoccus aestuariivivens]|uniref:Lipoprotein n=2 Tax=Paracoccus aestuariivivens TaxID=1820333 RepID=A0A6L6J9U1_9RHOB|nr:hypothetical protein [Paracoccus aestuariivivens]